MPRSIQLHVRLGAKRLEHRFALLLGESPEIELVVVAQEHAPLRRGRPLARCLQRALQGPHISRRERIERDADSPGS